MSSDEQADGLVAGAPKLAPFNPSSDEVVQRLISVTGLCSSDKLVDLGCGDGKVLLGAFAATGCRCVGVEYDQGIVARAHENIARAAAFAAE
jgi:predicted RNA methylase